jgi:AraC-like DNA-binding protein
VGYPHREWTVATLADHVAASRSTLASRFTELVGETPIRYLTRWRMHQATQLLRDTTLPAFRIAELVGYSTPFSFTKAFTRELGVPPSAYRQRRARTPHGQPAIP